MFNYPKILHLYWNNNILSFLNYLTIISFNKFHENWQIIVYIPEMSNTNITWTSNEQKITIKSTDYINKLKNIKNVKIEILSNEFMKQHSIFELNDVLRSDYLRFYLLHTFGGVWSDFDIIYIKNIENIFTHDNESIAFRCKLNKSIYHPVGFFISKKESNFFKHINDNQLQNMNNKTYQSIGATLLNKLCPNSENNYNVIFLDNTYYLYFQGCTRDITNLFTKLNTNFPNETVGIHWFNGSDISKKYINNFDKSTFEINSTINYLIKDYIDYID